MGACISGRTCLPKSGVSGRRAVSGGLRSAPTCSRVPVIPVSLFYCTLAPVAVVGFPAAGSADVSFCFDFFRCEIRKKGGNCEIHASFRPETGAESPRLCWFRPFRIYITICIAYFKTLVINKMRNINFYIIDSCYLPAPLKWILLLLHSVPDLRFVIFLKNT